MQGAIAKACSRPRRRAIFTIVSDAYTTPVKLAGRKLLTWFSVFNSFSYLLLSGHILILFLLRLEASRTVVGVVSSFLYVAFFFMVAGKKVVERYGVVRTFAAGWLGRYLSVLPLAAVPFIANAGYRQVALIVFIVAVFGFNASRGIGLVGQSPLMGELSSGRDRGAFLSRFQIIANLVAVFAGVTIALLLGERAPLERYALFILAGFGFGMVATAIMRRIPEPPGVLSGARDSLRSTVGRVVREKRFRTFVVAFFALAVVSGMARPFLVVYAREVYSQSDSLVIGYTVFGNLGAIAMGLLARLLLDRIGAKPLIQIFAALSAVGLLLAAWAPAVTPSVAIVLLSLLFFVFMFGSIGAESSSQNYFYALLTPREQLNMGIVYFLTLGVGGTIGGVMGGSALDLLYALAPEGGAQGVHRIYYLALAAGTAIVFLLYSRLERLGARSFRGTLGVIVSLRDLRAMTLVDRLEKTRDIDAERSVIRELGGSGSEFALERILARLASPSFVIRSEALRALETLPVNLSVERALIAEVEDHEFTTAHVAARILGNKGLRRGVSVLRDAVYSEDYLLCGAAMIALAKLEDHRAIDRIEIILRVSDNPYVLIHAAEAVRRLESRRSIGVLLGTLATHTVATDVRDEVILSAAGLIGIERWFYPHYARFLDDPSEAIEFLKHEAVSARLDSVIPVLDLTLEDPPRFAQDAASLLMSDKRRILPPDIEASAFAGAIADERLYRYERVRFLCAALLVAPRGSGRTRGNRSQ